MKGYMEYEKTCKVGCEDWVNVNENDIRRSEYGNLLSGVGADGKPSGLLTKFNDYKEQRWMAGTGTSSKSRGNSDMKLGKSIEANEVSDGSPTLRDSVHGSTVDVSPGDPPTPTCFTSGTQVLLANGQTKSIEDMCVGDLVLSYNEELGENQTSAVEQTMSHSTNEDIYTLHIGIDKLKVTGCHGFWVVRSGEGKWIPAKELSVGDLTRFSDGSLRPISEIGVERL